MAQALLEMRQIDKVFPGVKALSKVDFTLRAGEIHSLMGENGAGKTRGFPASKAGLRYGKAES